MSTATVISISNRALLSVGARAYISDLTEGSTEANAINTLFVPTYEALARTAWWNCLRKQVTLSLLKAAQGTPENPNGTSLQQPPVPWLYSYAYPSDCLKARYVVPSIAATGQNAVPLTSVNNAAPTTFPWQQQIRFEVAYDTDANGSPITVILTNQTQAQLVYSVNQPNPVIWDSQFQAAMVASLAAYLVPALSLNMSLMSASVSSAERLISEARASDANESSNSQDHVPDWMSARAGNGAFGYPSGLYNPGGFNGMIWP